MGFLDKVSKKLGIGDQEDMEEYEDKELEPLEKTPEWSKEGERDFERPMEARAEARGSQNVVDFRGASSVRDNVIATSKMKVVVIEPTSFDDSQEIANCLQEKRPVVINLNKIDKAEEMRIIDFISGTTYALNGDIRRVGERVFFCAPNNVNISFTEEEKKPENADLPWLKK